MKGSKFIHFLLVCISCVLGQDYGDVRIVGGPVNTPEEGRIEVYYSGVWGSICDDKWGDTAATVACKQLNFFRGEAKVATCQTPPCPAVYGESAGPIWLDDVVCLGREKNITECQHRGWNNSDCTHAEDTGVQCFGGQGVTVPASTTVAPQPTIQPSNCTTQGANPAVRTNGTQQGVGLVEVLNPNTNKWGLICDDTWGVLDARVVCRMMCFDPNDALAGAPVNMSGTPGDGIDLVLGSINCVGTEVDLNSCPHGGWGPVTGCDKAEAAKVTCVRLSSAPPTEPDPTLECAAGEIKVTFNKSRDPNLEPKHLRVDGLELDDPCMTKTVDTIRNLVIVKVPFNGCNTERLKNDTHLIYRNRIIYSPSTVEANIERVNTYRIVTNCEFPREGNTELNHNGPVEPLAQNITNTQPGQFHFLMKFYQGNSFTQEITEFPIQVPLGQWQNVGVLLENVDSGLKLVIPNCTAAPVEGLNPPVSVPLISDKCPSDSHVGVFTWNQTALNFRFQTFKFSGNYTAVYLSCYAFVCQIDEKTSQCDPTCRSGGGTGRRRRDTSHEHQAYAVNARGPLEIIIPQTETATKTTPAASTTHGREPSQSQAEQYVEQILELVESASHMTQTHPWHMLLTIILIHMVTRAH